MASKILNMLTFLLQAIASISNVALNSLVTRLSLRHLQVLLKRHQQLGKRKMKQMAKDPDPLPNKDTCDEINFVACGVCVQGFVEASDLEAHLDRRHGVDTVYSKLRPYSQYCSSQSVWHS